MSTQVTSIQHHTAGASQCNLATKRNNHPNWKEKSKTIFAHDMILNTENPKESNQPCILPYNLIYHDQMEFNPRMQGWVKINKCKTLH
jgi:hypothetical protein